LDFAYLAESTLYREFELRNELLVEPVL
jgi:hypothetical protein